MDLLTATIDLGAIAQNTRRLKELAGAAELMCVVKADGYNHGAVPVARAMERAGADYFGVATLAEAHKLREGGIEKPILAWIWRPEQDVQGAVDAGIDLAISSLEQARAVLALRRPAARLWIKVDTGLRRSGVVEEDWSAVFELLRGQPVVGLMSHFATADESGSPLVETQADAFHRAVALGRSLGLDLRINHIANSPATLTRTDLHFQMVRPGLALYGLSPLAGTTGADFGLTPAMRLAGRITVVKRIAQGEGTSYGHTWRAPEDGFTAVVPAGYADGIWRSLQGHLEVAIGGHRYPQVGRVCMDQFVVWLGSNPHGVAPGDEAVIFGDGSAGELSATELADRVGTINYEILCAPNNRVVRRYIGDDAAPATARSAADGGGGDGGIEKKGDR